MADQTSYEEGARAPRPDTTYSAPNLLHTGDPADEPKHPYGLTEPAHDPNVKERHADVRPSIWDASTPAIYTLEYQDQNEIRSVPPIALASLDAVREEVLRSAVDLWNDALSRQEAPTGWAVRARNEDGRIVASVDFEEVRQALRDDPDRMR